MGGPLGILNQGGFEHGAQRGHLCGTSDHCQGVNCPWSPDTSDGAEWGPQVS